MATRASRYSADFGLSNVLDAREIAHVRKQLPFPELPLLLRHHPNLLIEGRESAIKTTVVALTSDFYPTVHVWPDAPEQIAPSDQLTVIVPEIGGLESGCLDTLAQWISTPIARLQIVSTSSTPLIQSVERGEFPSDLYYRLNTVLLNLQR